MNFDSSDPERSFPRTRRSRSLHRPHFSLFLSLLPRCPEHALARPMLPTHTKRRPYSPLPPSHRDAPLSQPLSRLRARSRFTNLAVLLLASFTCLSVLLNIRYILFEPSIRNEESRPLIELFKPPHAQGTGVPRSIEEVVVRREEHINLTHLVIVAGHSVWNGAFVCPFKCVLLLI